MKIEILSQPSGGSVGTRLKKLLSDAAAGLYLEVTLVAAFAKRAGVSRIATELAAARAAGCNITGIIGIDHGGTSKEGFAEMFKACDSLFVVHSTNQQVTFHPKAYLFQGPSTAAFISGSSNMTAGGLFTNIELSTQIDFDLPADAERFGAVTSWLQELRDVSASYIVLADATNETAIRASLPPEQFTPVTTGAAATNGSGGIGLGLFGPGNFQFAPPSAMAAPVPSTSVAANLSQNTSPATQATASASPLFPSNSGWKKLSNFDVHVTQSPGSMQVPIALWPLFPAFTSTVVTSAGVSQPEVSFPARYIDGVTRKLAPRRLIEYPPAAGHSRPNIERRLAFHDATINPAGLTAGDVLVFEPLQNDPDGALMNITRLRPSDPKYNVLPGVTKRSAHGLLP